VWEKLNAEPQFVFPQNFNLTFCISSPHGAAQRISFGSLNVVKEKKISRDVVNKIKLLMSRLPPQCDIDEKKVLYFWFKESKLQTESMLNLPWRDVGDVLLYLERKDLVTIPTDTEYRLMKDVHFSTEIHLSSLVFQELAAKGLPLSEILTMDSTSEGVKEIKELMNKSCRSEVSGIHLPKGFRRRYSKVETEVWAKIQAGRAGFDDVIFGSDRVSHITSMTYSIATCPGSSGSFVTSLVIKEGKVTMYGAVHSCGTGTKYNRSRQGVIIDLADLCNFKFD